MVWPRSCDDCVGAGALHVPEPHLVRQVLVRDPKALTPLFYVSKPIGRSIRVQPAIRCDAINDDGGVPKNAEEKLDILGVETVDVIIDNGLDFSRGGLRLSRSRLRKTCSSHQACGEQCDCFSSCERHVTVVPR